MTSPSIAPHPESSTAAAIFMILVACVVLSGMDVTGKYLSQTYPVLFVLWGRYVFHTAITFGVYTAKRRSLSFLKANRPGLQFIRALAMIGATGTMYFALTQMPLGDAAAIQFLAPVIVTVLSGLFLGEYVGRRRIVAVGVAFVGVMFVARPGSGVFGWVAVLPLLTAILLAVYMIMTRTLRTMDHPDVTTFYSTALGSVGLTLAVPFVWHALSPFEWGLMVTMGLAGALGHFLIVQAFHSVEASLLAPFTYAQVLAAMMWGYIVFADVPSVWSTVGAGLIVGSGLYVWYREKLAKRASIEA